MPWQQQAVDVGLEVDDDGIPYYREVICTVMRQNGKSTMTGAVMAHRATLWKPQPQRIIYSAQDGNSARKKLIEDIAQGYYQRSKTFAPLVTKVLRGVGYEGVIFATGTRIDVLASSESAGHGRTLDLAVIDESFADVDDRREQAIQPAMATRSHAQVWNVSTAGTATSVFLRRKIEAGRQAVESGVDRGICYLEWSIPDDADIDDPEVWWQHMPALGWTITPDVVSHARATMSEGDFRRSFCNQWTVASERLIPEVLWVAACSDVRVDVPACFFVEVARDRSSASIAVADRFGTGELVDARGGVGWLTDRLVELHDKWGAPIVFDAGGPAGYLGTELEAEGVDVRRLNAREMMQASAWFYDRIADRRLSVRPAPPLDRSVEAAQRRHIGDSWVFSREANGVDCTPLVALAGALFAAAGDEPPTSTPYLFLEDFLDGD